MNVELLDKAAASALCPMFQALVPATNTIAVAGLASAVVNPVGIKIGMTAAAVSQLSMLGASATCSEVEIGPDPGPGVYDPRKGCVELSEGFGEVKVKGPGGTDVLLAPNVTGYKVEYYRNRPDIPGTEYTAYVQREIGGLYVREDTPWTLETGNYFELVPYLGAVCGTDAPGVPDNPPVPPVEYTDESTNCVYVVQFQGFIREAEDGPISPVYQIESKTDVRADGGRMGGCNLGPVIYSPGPNGPGGPGGPTIPPIPVPPNPPGPGGDGVPWWAAPLLAGSTSAALNLIGQELQRLLGPRLPEGSFTLQAPCDVDEQGNPLVQVWEYPEQSVQERMLAHQITGLEALQTHLNWKTPICGNEKPVLEGDWVTTRWLSTEKMDHSGVRLRKLFRYRTKSSRNLGQLSAYWESFTWEAGPVGVFHKGAWWGTPQIWAASQEEGQRVIRFAAAEAGLDPDQDGQWGTSSSRSPRYGMSGTMKIHLKDGFPWVSARESDSWPNTLARAHDPYGS